MNASRPAPNPHLRGNHAVYRRDELNRCPGCGRTHWYVGRVTAQCGFCETALPLADAGRTGSGIVRRMRVEEAV